MSADEKAFMEVFYRIPRQLIFTFIIIKLLGGKMISYSGVLGFMFTRYATNEIYLRKFEEVQRMEWKK